MRTLTRKYLAFVEGKGGNVEISRDGSMFEQLNFCIFPLHIFTCSSVFMDPYKGLSFQLDMYSRHLSATLPYHCHRHLILDERRATERRARCRDHMWCSRTLFAITLSNFPSGRAFLRFLRAVVPIRYHLPCCNILAACDSQDNFSSRRTGC